MAICANCKTNVPEGVAFCTNCGEPMGGAAPAAGPARAAAPSGGGAGEGISEVKKFFKKLEVADYSEKDALIKNFVLPNDKEALLQFAIAAASQLADSSHSRQWNMKLQETFTKAKIIGAGDATLQAQMEAVKAEVAVTEARDKVKSRNETLKRLGLKVGGPVFALVVVVIVFLFISGMEKKMDAETARLKAIEFEIQEDIRKGDLTAAREKAVTLNWSYSNPADNRDDKEKDAWDKRRDDFINEIDATVNKK
jgi:hypothetical protein